MTLSLSSQTSSSLARIVTLGVAARIVHAHVCSPRALNRCVRDQREQLVVWTVAMLIWPHVWMQMLRGCSPSSLIGLAWPYMVMLYDTSRLDIGTIAPMATIEPSMVCTLSFALAGLVGAHSHAQQARLFVAPVVLFMCIAMPSVAPRRADAVSVDAMQRVATTCAAGLVLSAVFYRGAAWEPSRVPLPRLRR